MAGGAPASLASLDAGIGARIRWWMGEAGARGLRGSCRAFREWLLAVEASMPWYASPERRRGVEAALDAWCREGNPGSRISASASPNLEWIVLARRDAGALCRVDRDGAIERAPPIDCAGFEIPPRIDDGGNVAFAYVARDGGDARAGWWLASNRIETAPLRLPNTDTLAWHVRGNAGRLQIARASPARDRVHVATVEAGAAGRVRIDEIPFAPTGDPRFWAFRASDDGRYALAIRIAPPYEEIAVLDLERRAVRRRVRLPGVERVNTSAAIAVGDGAWLVTLGTWHPASIARAYLVRVDGPALDLSERLALSPPAAPILCCSGPGCVLDAAGTVHRVDARVGCAPVARTREGIGRDLWLGPDGRGLEFGWRRGGGAAPALFFRTGFAPREPEALPTLVDAAGP